jgi:8-oxo-dGTP pyrophosphatase MutT (NUDIX family)
VSLHADALATLLRWDPPDAAQGELRRDYLALLRERSDGVWRSGRPDHLTASALVVAPERGTVLLGLHGRARLWLQMGGHCEPQDATLAEAALREATEESGIDGLTLLPDPARLDRHGAPCAADARFHLDVQYVAVAPPDAVERCSEESIELRWVPYDHLPDPTDVRELVERARVLVAGLPTPASGTSR